MTRSKLNLFLKVLLTNFPGDKSITLQFIDLYIKSNKNDEALKYIKVAKEADPANYSSLFCSRYYVSESEVNMMKLLLN